MHHKRAGYRALIAVLSLLPVLTTACHRGPAGVSSTVSADGRPLKQDARNKELLAWNFKTTLEAYESGDHKNSKWDYPAKKALTEYAEMRGHAIPVDGQSSQFISDNLTAAVEAGCDDPMVNYLYIKFAMDQKNSPDAFAQAMAKTAKDMEQSSYPPIRKFYAAARAMEQFMYAYRTNAADQPAAHDLDYMFGENMMGTLTDKTVPPEEAYEVADLCMSLAEGNVNSYEQGYKKLEPLMFASWPNDSTSYLFKGKCYIMMAWLSRGSGYADKVTAQGWQGFSNNLAVADAALNKAWELDTNDERIPIEMMELAVGEQKPRAEMEVWFGRAMTIDPNSSDACAEKLRYLQPVWYGSAQDMIAFGRECVANTDWGGRVPLTIVDAYSALWEFMPDSEAKSNYWKQPQVWLDIKSAYDRFFELNPTAVNYYQYYALYAYRAGQWDALNGLIPKLGSVNYSIFGGQAEYDKMVQLAQEHAGKGK